MDSPFRGKAGMTDALRPLFILPRPEAFGLLLSLPTLCDLPNKFKVTHQPSGRAEAKLRARGSTSMSPRRKKGAAAKVVVVGAGIVGASIAYHLSRRDVAVTVVDKAQPGSGASSHSFAWINGTGKSPVGYHDFNRRSLEMWGRFARGLDVDVGLRWGGHLEWEGTVEGASLLRDRVQQLQKWGYPCQMIDEAELRRLEPGLSPGPVAAAAVGSADGQVDPRKVVDACLLRASEAGALVRQESPVIGLNGSALSQGRTRIDSVQTEQGEVPCDVLVLASGVDTTKLAAMAGINVPQEYSPGVVVNTDPLPPVLNSVLYAPEIDAGHPKIHVRQRTDGTVQIGESVQESVAEDGSQAHAQDLMGRAARYLPALAGATPVLEPVGYRPMPLDGFSVLGFHHGAPNVYVALTHSGVTLAPLIGELAALEIVDGAKVDVLRPYRPDRFSSPTVT